MWFCWQCAEKGWNFYHFDSFFVVTLIQSITARNEYVRGIFYRNNSGVVEIPSDIPPEATEVYLQDNQITVLRTGRFSHLTQCTKLDIHNSSIATIEEGAFSGMGQLEILFLFYNRISFLQKSMFNGLSSLTYLHMSGNLIETISDGCFSDLRNLNYLYLGDNKLSEISGNMWLGLSVPTRLHLYYNHIATLQPGALNHLPKLGRLLLYNNPLTTFSYTIFNPSLYPETDGHPRRIEMAPGVLKCNTSLCWLKQGEQKGWITWWEYWDKIHHPDCLNFHLWSDVDLNCPMNGL